jgi:hypothetical protein
VKVVELLEAGAGMKTVDQLAYGPFLDRLVSAPDRVLLLDYDGTLAPFQIDRNLAVPYPEIRLLLARIRAAGTQVILISGRAPYDLAVLSGIDPRPEIWGSHGFERLKPDGCYESEALSRQQRAGLAMAAKLLQSEGMESRAEVKPGGVAAPTLQTSSEEFGGSGHLCLLNSASHCSNSMAAWKSAFPAVTKGSPCAPFSPRAFRMPLSPIWETTAPTKTRFAR